MASSAAGGLGPEPSRRPAIGAGAPRIGPALRAALLLALVSVLATGAVIAGRAVGTDPGRPDILDFNVFHLAGGLAWEGHIADAYTRATMGGIERALGGGRDVYMPYAYPPLFGLVAALLALLPTSAALAAFSSAALLLFVRVICWLGGAWAWPALIAMAPALFINLLVGQNGSLTAGLAGLAAGLALAGRGASAGLAAGALAAMKPHTGVALPLLFLFRRDWRAIVVLAATALGLTALAVAILGPATIAAFRAGLSEAGRFMASGHFPLHRLTSIYACALDFGAPAGVALLVHAMAAIAVLAATAVVERRLCDRRAAAGITIMATVFVSPYFYDYDLTILGVGLALALPGLACGRWSGRIGLLLVAVALIESIGIVQAMCLTTKLSVGGPGLIAWYAAILVAVLPRDRVSLRGVEERGAGSVDEAGRRFGPT